MAQTKIKAGLFEGIIGNGTDGYFLMSNGDGTMTWSTVVINPTITSIAYPGSVTAADPAGGETITVTGTGFKTGAAVTIGGTAAPAVSYVSETQITFTTPAKAAGDYDIVVTNTDTGSATYINGISYNGVPAWTTAAGSLGTFASDTTISTITLQATEPDAGTITFSITNGALPTGLSLTGADIDGTTSLETADTLYTFTVTATDDESQATPRTFTITVTKVFINTENFTINTYTGNGSTQSVGGKIDTAADFNGSNAYISNAADIGYNNSVSMWFWVQPSGVGTYSLFGRENGGGYEWGAVSLYYDGTDYNLNMQLRNSSYLYQAYQNFTLSDGWHHIVFTFDSNSGFTAYIDNSEVTLTTTASSGTVVFPGGTSSIGSQYGNGDPRKYFNGLIDQVRVFNKKLTSSEVSTLYNEPSNLSTKSTTDIFGDGSGIALYEFEEGAKDTGGVSGYIGAGGIFNGSSSYIDLGSSALKQLPMTISLWLNPITNANATFYSNYSSSTEGFYCRVQSDGTFLIDAYNGGSNRTLLNNTTGSISDNTWSHVAITFDSSNVILYINGSETDRVSTNANGIAFTVSEPTKLGVRGTSSDWYNGKIDQVRIFNKALSSSEVTTLYGETSASATKSTTDIFSDGSGIALYELEGNANDTGDTYNGTATNVSYAYNGTPINVGFVGTSFQPDLVWIKDRDNANPHELADIVRGVSGTLNTNAASTEYVNASYQITSFDTNGFTVVDDSAGNYAVNGNNINYVAWCWKAGGTAVSGTGTGGVTNVEVSANTAAGFSIVKYTGSGNTGATITHGLNSKPQLSIIKNLDSATNWDVSFDGITGGTSLNLDTTTGVFSPSLGYHVAGASTLTLNSGGSGVQRVNTNNEEYIAYCFHSVGGYQKVGSYSGTNSSQSITGLGFAPRFVMIKNATDAGPWVIQDKVRNPSNPSTKHLRANTDGIEDTGAGEQINFDSDGFTLNYNGCGNVNCSGYTFIYLAIA